MKFIENHYASERGFVRLQLANLESLTGRLNEFKQVDFNRVERLVFICLGNICRSPFGEVIAKNKGLNTAGFGLSTTTGSPAFELAIETAKKFDIDLKSHIATDWSDFELRGTDLLLVMEVRHARRVKCLINNSKAQIALLGQWSTPQRLHIHDPHSHDEVYFENCYNIIKSATENLISQCEKKCYFHDEGMNKTT